MTKQRIKIDIKANFGSMFQEKLWTSALKMMFKIWMNKSEEAHKKNLIDVKIFLKKRGGVKNGRTNKPKSKTK